MIDVNRLWPVLHRGWDEPMPGKFGRLAVYNAEVGRGIVHTPEYDAEMAELQREFDGWSAAAEAARR